MKDQEFYIGITENGSLIAFHGLTQTTGLSKLFKVREVNPKLDSAIEKMVQALECVVKSDYETIQEAEALAAYRKAME